MQENLWDKLIKVFTDQGVSEGLAIAYIIVSALLVIMAIVALVMWIMVAVRYSKSNNTRISSGKTSFEVAKEALAKFGLSDIQVKKAGFFRAWFYGNSYSIRKKTIFLRGNIADKNTVTAVGLALQKVGVAKLCESGSKIARTRNAMQVLGLFGPFLFIPIILAGFLVDYFVFKEIGTFSIACIVIGLLILCAGFIVTLLNIPVEKKANDMALEMIDESNLFNEQERNMIAKVFKTYIIAYVCDFIVTVLRIIQIILEIAIKVQANKK